MQKRDYSVYQKLIVTTMSVVMGCETNADINEKLGPEKLAMNMFDMESVPDQSGVAPTFPTKPTLRNNIPYRSLAWVLLIINSYILTLYENKHITNLNSNSLYIIKGGFYESYWSY